MGEDLNALLEALLGADRALRSHQARSEEHFQRLRRETGAGLEFLGHVGELSAQARSAAGPDPRPAAFEVLDRAADRLRQEPETRSDLFDFFWACPGLVQAHLEYVERCIARCQDSGERLWLDRALAGVALGRGGRDFRDVYLSMQHLLRVARNWELPLELALPEAAGWAHKIPGEGGLRGSVGDFLKGFLARP